MRTSITLLLILVSFFQLQAQVDLQYKNNKTVSYAEAIEYYEQFAKKSEICDLNIIGTTDVGKPLHLFVISNDKLFTPEEARKAGKQILFINNGIHPGEPCGIDASIQLVDDILQKKNDLHKLLDETVICIIPVYNIGGALNRNPYNRANQNGPEEHGFRANAKNHDLNRDFVKMDTKNAWSLIETFQKWNPDVLVDTHTSNGADYQYTMTLLPSHPNTYDPVVGNFMRDVFTPSLYKKMESTYEMIPYVNVYNRPPDNGYSSYVDAPRYTSGYAALFNTIAYITETHMFKPFEDRVLSTYYFLIATLELMDEHKETILENRAKATENTMAKKEYILEWQPDSSKVEKLNFKGYEAKQKKSKVTGFDRLYYDRNDPFEKEIPFYNAHTPLTRVTKADYYIIPQAWQAVIDRLQTNGVEMKQLSNDAELEVEVYYIESFRTSERPYNGHYNHSNVEVRKDVQTIQFYTGDYVVQTNQTRNNLIIHTLEPVAPDSYFNWNFFDEILSRKEYFSPYIFEETAEELLNSNPELKAEFEKRLAENEQFAKNWYLQLNFIYEHSPYYEKTHNRYPIARLNGNLIIPLK